MKVVLNAASAKLGGAARYVRNLAAELAHEERDEFVFVVPPELAGELAGHARNIRIVPTAAAHWPAWKRIYFDQVLLRKLLQREGADLLFSTANMGMSAAPCPQLLLVRNSLQFSPIYGRQILARMNWRARLDSGLRRWLICRSVEWADLVMFPSASMLDEVRPYVSQAAWKKFRVNAYGTMVESFTPTDQTHDGRLHHPVRLLHVSHYADHKNIGVMLRALEMLCETGLSDVVLTTTADISDARYVISCCRNQDLATLAQPQIQARVRAVGDIPHERLPAMYWEHDIFIFPSLAESYGHPLVEAMASGVPVVAADLPYAREVCGEAALYFDPLSPTALADQLRRVIEETVLRDQLRRRGLQRAAGMSWRSHVVNLLRLFRELVDRPDGKHAQK